MARYVTDNASPHGFQEEMQWARIMGRNAAAGMVIVLTQKLCTLVHELQPAYAAGVLTDKALPHFQARISRRVDALVRALELNGLGGLEGAAEMAALRGQVQACTSLEELVALSEQAHTLNHRLTDALEQKIVETEQL